MCRFKAAIFDADGTIIDSMYVWEKVDRDFLTEHGIAVTQEYSDAVRGMFFRTAAEYTKAKYGLDKVSRISCRHGSVWQDGNMNLM